MLTKALRSLWAEPRPANPPQRVWRDGVLIGVLLVWSVAEAVLREDIMWRPLVLAAMFVVLAPLWWRRTHPLAASTSGRHIMSSRSTASTTDHTRSTPISTPSRHTRRGGFAGRGSAHKVRNAFVTICPA